MTAKQRIAFAKVVSDDAKGKAACSQILSGEVPGAEVFNHSIPAGSSKALPPLDGTFRIMLLIEGAATFAVEGSATRFTERAAFIPGLSQNLTIKAESDTQALELQWKPGEEALKELDSCKTNFPYMQLYSTSKQYRDRNKSDKTISRVVVEQRTIPGFCMGSVESYGFDRVAPHPHPMLDQFFFSFPENDIEVLIDDKRIPMKGNILLHIPLGSNHGVEVMEGRHMHYMWIDFFLGQSGLDRLDKSHIPTGTMRSFDNKGK